MGGAERWRKCAGGVSSVLSGGIGDGGDVMIVVVVVVVGKLCGGRACGGSEVEDGAEGCSRLVTVRQMRGQRKLGSGGKHIFPLR